MSNRRNFLKYTAGGIASLASASTLKANTNTTPDNLIFLYVDDLNDYVGFMGGYQDTHTPNMNFLAEQGTAFTNAHAVVPACNPSRVSTLFGADPTNSGAYTNDDHYWDMPYLNDKKSLFRHLGDNGYDVYGGGKLFHSPWKPHNDVEWNEYYASSNRLHANYARDTSGNNLNVSGVTSAVNGLFPHDFGPYGSDTDYSDHNVALWAEDKITNAPDGFVIGVGFEKPHFPFVVPQKYFDLYDNAQVLNPAWRAEEDIQDLPQSAQFILKNNFASQVIPYLEREGRMRDHVHAYLAAISFVDDMIGKVVRAWEQRKDNTAIILVSDHGQFLGEKLQIGKLYLWDRATRVPLVMAGPGIIKNRQSSPMSLLNIYPTVCEMMGVPVPSHLDGTAVNASLASHIPRRQTAHSYFLYNRAPYTNYVVKSLRIDRFRITEWPDGYEVYDYLNDPMEIDNLWPRCSDWQIFSFLKARL